MRININRPPKHVRKEQERMARQEWHKKFAWKATKVDHTDVGHRVVWFENYWCKEKIGPTQGDSPGDGRYFEKYSEKEYFKKKLDGDFDKHETMVDEATASSIASQIRNQMNKQYPSGGLHKKDGPNSGVNFKKYVIGRADQDIEVESIFLGDEEEDGWEEDK